MKIYFKILILVWPGWFISTSQAQNLHFGDLGVSSLESSIRYGKLENGLTYYIKPLPKSSKKIRLQLYVLAGAYQEDSNQQELAHFLEHMAFKSTKHFPLGIGNHLANDKDIQVSLRDIQGVTSRIFTRYHFEMPPDNKKALNTGLTWFNDIATNMNLKKEEIDSERGAFIQEFITGFRDNVDEINLISKLRSRLHPCPGYSSNLIEHVETFDSERLREFYKKWYTSDRMAIVVIGNIEDVDELENEIRSNFDGIKAKNNSSEISDCNQRYLVQPPQFAVVESKGAAQPDIASSKIFYRYSPKDGDSLVLVNLRIDLLTTILNNRFNQISNIYSPFVTGIISYIPQYSALLMRAKIRNKKEEEAFKTISGVFSQFQKFGALEEEFDEAVSSKIKMLQGYDLENQWYWVNEIENHFVYGEALPSFKQDSLIKWLEEYNVESFNRFLEELNLTFPEDIGIVAPTEHSALDVTEKQVRAWVSEASNESTKPFSPRVIPDSIMNSSEVDKLLVKEFKDKGIGKSGAREFILKNGVKIILYPLNSGLASGENQIMLHGFKSRGALNFPEEDYFSAINAPLFVKNSGAGTFDKFDLQGFLAANGISWTSFWPYIENQESGIRLSTTLEGFESGLQFIYLFMTEPRVNSLAYEDWMSSARSSFLSHRGFDPQLLDLRNVRNKILRDYSGSTEGTEWYNGLEKVNMNKGSEIVKELFGDASNFTFLIVGNFQPDSIMPLINKYIGNLPPEESYNPFELSDSVWFKPPGPLLVEIPYTGKSKKRNFIYRPEYIVHGVDTKDWKEELIVELLGRVINSKVQALRFEKGFSLYVMTTVGGYNEVSENYEFIGYFNCTPEEYPLLRREFKKITAGLKFEVISEDYLSQSLKPLQEDYDPENPYSIRRMLNRLYYHYRFDRPWLKLNEVQRYLNTITPHDILEASQKYLKDDYFYEFVIKN